MTHWPDLEAALQGRAGWRRVGREYHGPCPVSGAGRDCCFASEGRAGDVALGCRKCGGNGGKLDSESFLAHLAALVGETARHVAAHATNDRATIETPSPLPARAWRASEPVDDTPGARVLFGAAGKRPSVAASDFAGGRRVCHAGGDVDRGVHLVEGPLDALALVYLARLGAVELAGAVFGAQGTPGFTARACPGRGPVLLWPDGDGPGERAAAAAPGRPEPAPPGARHCGQSRLVTLHPAVNTPSRGIAALQAERLQSLFSIITTCQSRPEPRLRRVPRSGRR